MKISELKINKLASELAGIINYLTVTASSNIYTLDLSKNMNFAIETTDTNAKTIAFSNIPNTVNLILSVGVKLNFTNNATINFPASVVWKDAVTPIFTAGKQYLLMLVSYDNGTTWLASYVGGW